MLNISNKNILVLTDFSDVALNAALYAAALSRQLKTPKILLYYSDYIPSAIDIPLQDAIRQEHEWKKNEDRLSALKRKVELLTIENTTVHIRIDERPLDFGVDELIAEHDIGIAVMGMKGKNLLEQVLIGSNAVIIAKRCPVPLLVVPEEAIFKGISKVVFACDLKEFSNDIPYDSIKGFVQDIKAGLLVLNVDQYDEHRFNPEIKAKEEELKSRFGPGTAFYHSEEEEVTKGIERFVTQHGADLVIAVPKEYGVFERLFHQSVTKKMIYHSHTPLLLFKH
jgi:nucleotide-binding universal stress UspA family protein